MHGIDAHCHLEYMKNPEDVIKEARKRMNGFVTSVASPEHAPQILALSSKNKDFVHVALGIHPVHFNESIDEYMDFIKNNRNSIVAVGEVGLDYHHITEEHDREQTKKLFLDMIELANSIKKPIIVHTRNAMPDTLRVLEHAKCGVMMHFFSGSTDELNECIERGYYISYTTITCVSKKYRKLAKHTPIERMLLETDAPWLDPVKQEKVVDDARNEKDNNVKASDYEGNPFLLTNRPWNIALTAQKLEKELHTPAQRILQVTEENTRRLFGL